MRTLAYLALLQNFVRIQALKTALIGATIIMLTEGSSMAATITVTRKPMVLNRLAHLVIDTIIYPPEANIVPIQKRRK